MTPRQRWLLILSVWTVALSGGVYAIFKYFGEGLALRFPILFPVQDDAFSVVRHPLQPWALDLHVLAAPLLVFAVGWIYKDHVLAKLGIPGVPVRRSGLMGVLLFVPMVLTGYLLQTVTNESAHGSIVAAHLIAGIIFTAAFVVHVVLAPKKTKRNEIEPAPSEYERPRAEVVGDPRPSSHLSEAASPGRVTQLP